MMTKDQIAKLHRSLIRHEGLKHFPYVDTVGKITIGIGYDLSDRGLDDKWINDQYNADVNYFYNQLDTFSWYKNLNPDRQIVLIDMAFIGWKRFLEFTNMLAALEKQDYKIAALEMINSEWAKQVGQRAIDLAHAMQEGVYNI